MTQKEKVLFISPQPFFEWRGSSIRVKFNVMALSEQGYDVSLLTLPIGEDVPGLDLKVIRAWNIFNSKKIAIGPSLLKLWFDLILFIQGALLVRKNKYTVLHGTEEAGFICFLLSKLCGAKYIYEKHSDIASYKKGGLIKRLVLGLYAKAEDLTIKHADLVICTGPGLSEQTKSTHPNQTIITIPDIPSSLVEAKSDDILSVRNQMLSHKDDVLVSYVGSFAEYQGVDVIFDAIPQVLAENKNIKFMIIGGSLEEIEAHKSKLSDLGIENYVHFINSIHPDELPAYLSASDILLAPRKSGINSPLKILDYFKAASAIVATNMEANKRLLNDDNAMLCDFNAADFAQEILTLANDEEKRNEIRLNAYKLYQTHYNFSTFKSSIDEAYGVLGNFDIIQKAMSKETHDLNSNGLQSTKGNLKTSLITKLRIMGGVVFCVLGFSVVLME